MIRPDPEAARADKRVVTVIVAIIAVGFLAGLAFLALSVGLDWE
jgi:hypothetical protein